ncbi:hypothetical protein A6A05_04585 [Magnetospirillum moscoviense]|uniref:Flagellar protein FlaF n=1 Tax=Magnetospirillum moscoviense TaxID=1437059 RepID=A0A178M9I2_9PROT|nr:hypothetical protein A6A05_04585 [Magnetospirillum moscoviense]
MTEAARRIADSQRPDAEPGAFLAAIRLNWRLWTIFQAELTSPNTEVPMDLRMNMLSLCNFVDKTTVDIIADPVPAKAEILITINRNIAAGLFTTPADQPASSENPPAAPAGSADFSA